jgi:phosphatidylglycerophosphatase A
LPKTENGSRPLVALAVATAFGVGSVPFAPGTFGSAAGLIVWRLLPPSPLAQAAAIVALFAAGSWAGTAAERYYRTIDPGAVVIDEVMGMLITLFAIPVGWRGALLGFFIFRAADVLKPYPANRVERLPGGLGVMADDGVAAVYANIVLRLCLAVWHLAIG